MYIVCITGASGVLLGYYLVIELGQRTGEDIVLVVSKWGWRVTKHEVPKSVLDKAFKYVYAYYSEDELDAPIASGTCKFKAVVVVPCTLKTLSDIAYARPGSLIVRVIEVALKEQRKVIIVPREAPLHKDHIRLLNRAAQRGIIVVPPVPAFYLGTSLEECLYKYIIGKILDLLGIKHDLYREWRSMMSGHHTEK